MAPAFRYLDLTDVKPASAITAAPVATAHMETFDGLVLDVTLIDQDGTTWAEFAAKGNDAAADITKRTAGWAYKIPDAAGEDAGDQTRRPCCPAAAGEVKKSLYRSRGRDGLGNPVRNGTVVLPPDMVSGKSAGAMR